MLLNESATLALRQMLCVPGATVIIGVGFTVILNIWGAPTQPFAVGVTVNIPVIGAVPVLVAVNDATTPPDPLDPSPI